MSYKDKEKSRAYQKVYRKGYYLKNKEEILKSHKKYRLKNKKKLKIKAKLNVKLSPWKSGYKSAKQRCDNPNCKDYKYYGGRGIKFLITEEELKKLWFRDKAWLLNRPSIDREENDGN